MCGQWHAFLVYVERVLTHAAMDTHAQGLFLHVSVMKRGNLWLKAQALQ